MSKNLDKIKEKQKINARKALEEAMRKNKSAKVRLPKELDGRDGPGLLDLMIGKNGITSDFRLNV